MQLNVAKRELTIKVVYYGPGLSGKTTNLQAIHARMNPTACGRLMTLDTADDRTLFFDVMPLYVRSKSGLKVRIKLYTVPGQVMHNSTRRLVLQGADAVVFVADSRRSQSRANNEYWQNMLANLRQNGIQYGEIPIVIQFNKRDLPDVRTDAELEELAKRGKEPIYPAVAVRGEGVFETLTGLLRLTWRRLDEQHRLARNFGLGEAAFIQALEEAAQPALAETDPAAAIP